MAPAAMAHQRMMTAPPSMMSTITPQRQLDWDSEFSKVAEQDTKGKGKAVEDVNDLEARFRELSADDWQQEGTSQHPDYMSDFEK